jgi:serine/threonine protein kinase
MSSDGLGVDGVLAAGSVLANKFEIVGLLGRGGFGITYDGYDRRLKRRVAIKELFPDGAIRQGSEVLGSPTLGIQHLRTRFIEEAQSLAKFDFPGIVRVLEAFEDNGTAYMIMEHLEGENIEERCERLGRLTSDETSTIVSQLCEALTRVHAAGILHRDVKPSNVILHPTRGAVLIDFGSARELVSGPGKAHTQMVSHGYAAPEQYSVNSRLGPATDIYGLGATAWHAVAGEAPPSTLDRVSGTELPAISGRAPGITPQLAMFIESALTMDYVSRPATVNDARQMLGATPQPLSWPNPASTKHVSKKTVALPSDQFGRSSVTGSPEAVFPEAASPKKKTRILAGVGVAALALSGVGALVATRGSSTTATATDSTVPQPESADAATTVASTTAAPVETRAPGTTIDSPTTVLAVATAAPTTTAPTTTAAPTTAAPTTAAPTTVPPTAAPASPSNLKLLLIPTTDSEKAAQHKNAIQLAINEAKVDLAKAGMTVSLVVSREPSAVNANDVIAVFSNGYSTEAQRNLLILGDPPKKPLVVIDATSDGLTKPNVFRTIASDSQQATAAAKVATDSGATTALILGDSSEDSRFREAAFADSFPGARVVVLDGSNAAEAVRYWTTGTAVFIAASNMELVQPVLEASKVRGRGRIVLGVDGMFNLGNGSYLRGARCLTSTAPVAEDAAFARKLRAAGLGKSDEESSLFAYTSTQAVLREIIGGASTGDALISNLQNVKPTPQIRMYTYSSGWM